MPAEPTSAELVLGELCRRPASSRGKCESGPVEGGARAGRGRAVCCRARPLAGLVAGHSVDRPGHCRPGAARAHVVPGAAPAGVRRRRGKYRRRRRPRRRVEERAVVRVLGRSRSLDRISPAARRWAPCPRGLVSPLSKGLGAARQGGDRIPRARRGRAGAHGSAKRNAASRFFGCHCSGACVSSFEWLG